jgi:hypothetical protein
MELKLVENAKLNFSSDFCSSRAAADAFACIFLNPVADGPKSLNRECVVVIA